jgi:hypothetical protein
MRRLVIAAALAAMCTTTAACTSASGKSPSSSPTSAAASTAAAASANTRQVCSDAQKVLADSSGRFSQEMTRIMKAASTGDKSATADAVTTVKRLFTTWAKGLREQAAKATDPGLKAALDDVATQIKKVSDSIRSMNDLKKADALLDSPSLKAAYEKKEQYCG